MMMTEHVGMVTGDNKWLRGVIIDYRLKVTYNRFTDIVPQQEEKKQKKLENDQKQKYNIMKYQTLYQSVVTETNEG